MTKRLLLGAALLLLAGFGCGKPPSPAGSGNPTAYPAGTTNPVPGTGAGGNAGAGAGATTGTGGNAGTGAGTGTGTGTGTGAAPQEQIDLSASVAAGISIAMEEKTTVDGSETTTQVSNETDAEINAYGTIYDHQNDLF